MIVSTGFMVIQPTKKTLCSELIYMLLTTKEMITYLHSKAEMSVSTYPSIRPEDITNINIVLASDDVLLEIKKILKPLFDLQCQKYKENISLKNLANIIHQKLATIKEEAK